MNQLLKLFALNKDIQNRQFTIKAEGNEATIYLYDAIVGDDLTAEYWGGVSANQFIRELNNISAPVIHLRINSPGGDVFAARVMELAIRQHTSKVIAHIDGYAASAASFLAVACDEVEISQGGFVMIHKASTICWGNEDDMTHVAGLLGKLDATLVDTYVQATGQEATQLAEWMKAETWFNSDEAIKYGFADRLAETKVENKVTWNLSAYAHAPVVNAPAPEPEPKPVTNPEPKPEPVAEPEDTAQFIGNDHRVRQQQRVRVAAQARIG